MPSAIRCAIFGATLSLIAMPVHAAESVAAPTCPSTAIFGPDLATLRGYHIVKGPDGASRIEPFALDAKRVPMLKTGKILNLFDLPTSPTRGVEIVAGPAGVHVAAHPAPYREMFVVIAGSTTLEVGKTVVELTPGMVMYADDVGATDGHGGQTGPCGYVALSIAP